MWLDIRILAYEPRVGIEHDDFGRFVVVWLTEEDAERWSHCGEGGRGAGLGFSLLLAEKSSERKRGFFN